MSRRDTLGPRENHGGASLFAEAWHADALAIANVLTSTGVFSAAEWSASLGNAVLASEARGEPDDDEHYYGAVLVALESLIDQSLPEVGSAIPPRVEQWRRAYLNTPHGQPVELQAGATPHGETEQSDGPPVAPQPEPTRRAIDTR